MDFDGAVGGARTAGVRTEEVKRGHARSIEKIQENWNLQSLQAWFDDLPSDIRPGKTPTEMGTSFIANLGSISARVTSARARALFIAECNHVPLRWSHSQNILDTLKRSRNKEPPGQLKTTKSSKSGPAVIAKPRQNEHRESSLSEANARRKQRLHDLQVDNDKGDGDDGSAPIRSKQTSTLKRSSTGRQSNHIASARRTTVSRKDLLRDLGFDDDDNDDGPSPKKLKKSETLTLAGPPLKERETHGIASPSISPMDTKTELELFGESTELVAQKGDAAAALPLMTLTCEPLLEQFSDRPGDLSREIYAACRRNAIENENFFGGNRPNSSQKDDSLEISHPLGTGSEQSSQMPLMTEQLDTHDITSGQPLRSSASVTNLPLVAEALNPAAPRKYITTRRSSDPFLHPRRTPKNNIN